MITAWVFLAGLAVGSFLNVCIYRLPRKISVIKPGSHCPSCKTPVKIYDNIPVLSWFILKGRCRNCGEPFSFKYPLVELLTGLLSLLVLLTFGFTLKALSAAVFIYLLIPVVFIDLEHQIIPNGLIITGLVAGLILQVVGYWYVGQRDWLDFVLGIAIGSGFLIFASLLGRLLFKKESMGMGDIKLGLVLGMFLGPRDVTVGLLLAFLYAAVIGGGYLFLKRSDSAGVLPFGPYLALGAVSSLFVGGTIATAYMNWAGL